MVVKVAWAPLQERSLVIQISVPNHPKVIIFPAYFKLNYQQKTFAVNCKWSHWGKWGSCSEKCGGGTQRQTRFISRPVLYGGKDCEGSSWNEQACNTEPCPRLSKGTHSTLISNTMKGILSSTKNPVACTLLGSSPIVSSSDAQNNSANHTL